MKLRSILMAGALLSLVMPAATPAQNEPAGAPSGATAVRTVGGTTNGGAVWIGEVPANWNGTVLLFGHGYSPRANAPQSAPPAARTLMLAQGYALVASSYATPGWALENAVPDQIAALDAFTAAVSKPKQVIAWGDSMGGLVTAALAERYPQRLNGAIPMCASAGGAVPMMNMALDGAFALTHLLDPDGAIPITGAGDNPGGMATAKRALEKAVTTPEGRARIALAGVLGGVPSWTRPGKPRPDDLDYRAQAEEIAAALPLAIFLPRGDQERRAGGAFSWNDGVRYDELLARSGRMKMVQALYREAGLDLGADLKRLQAAQRLKASPSAVAYMRTNFTPTGNIGVPVLSLHTIGDGMTSPSLQRSYVATVVKAGKGSMIASAWIERAGHCSQSGDEMSAAVHALEHRLKTGRWDVSLATLNAVSTPQGGGTKFINFLPGPVMRACSASEAACRPAAAR